MHARFMKAPRNKRVAPSVSVLLLVSCAAHPPLFAPSLDRSALPPGSNWYCDPVTICSGSCERRAGGSRTLACVAFCFSFRRGSALGSECYAIRPLWV